MTVAAIDVGWSIICVQSDYLNTMYSITAAIPMDFLLNLIHFTIHDLPL